MSETAGYSGTPLSKKLGLRAGMRVLALQPPPDYRDWLQPLPDDLHWVTDASPEVDLVHLFCSERRLLAEQLQTLRTQLRSDAVLWVSWPKKAARVATDISEDEIRTLALPLGWVDIKVCAVSAVWSGLKLVIRKSLRSA